MDQHGWVALALAGAPAAIGLLNCLLLWAPQGRVPDRARISILIPARDDVERIEACIRHAVGQIGVAVEVLVLDAGSRDDTAARVAAIAAREPRVRLLSFAAPGPDWHHAARQHLAEAARGTHLLFIEPGVRLDPHAAAALAGQAARMGAGMISGVPRQRIRSLGAALTVPMAGVARMAWLPGGGRAVTRIAPLAASCDQMMMMTRAAFDRVGAMADATLLARRLRAAGIATEMVDASRLATRDVGGAPGVMPAGALLLVLAHAVPLALLPAPSAMLALGLLAVLRVAVAVKTAEAWWAVPLHPAALLATAAIQARALLSALLARAVPRMGRAAPVPGVAGP